MIWLTEIRAIDPQTGELVDWCGPQIDADSFEEAENYCNSNGLGYCKIVGQLDEMIELMESMYKVITRVCKN